MLYARRFSSSSFSLLSYRDIYFTTRVGDGEHCYITLLGKYKLVFKVSFEIKKVCVEFIEIETDLYLRILSVSVAQRN